jgi:RND family efflux transporter MFP subunit
MRLLPSATALLVIAACSGEPPAAPPPTATPVGIGTVAQGPALPPIFANGFVATREELKLSFKVGGVVRSITVRGGDRVRAGQVLATLELAEVEAEVEQARQLAAKADRDLARGEKLRADEVISEEELEALRTQAAVAAAGERAAAFNRSFATITAARDGVVLRKLVEAREVVQPGQTIVVIGPENGGYIVRAGLADREVVQLVPGDAATATLDACPGQSLPGRVSEIPAAADEGSGLFAVEVSLAPVAGSCRLASGLVARLRIDPGIAAAGTLPYVPIAAIIEADGNEATVYVPEDGFARRRLVRVAFIAGETVAIAAGLAPGEQVITDGALYLADGEAIVPAPAAAPATTTGATTPPAAP